MFGWLWRLLAWLFPSLAEADDPRLTLVQRFKAASNVWTALEQQELSAPRAGTAEVREAPLRLRRVRGGAWRAYRGGAGARGETLRTSQILSSS